MEHKVAEEKKPFWGRCDDCQHCYPVAYAPMPLATMAEVCGKAICPMCGSKKIMVAKQDNGVLNESMP